MNYHVIYNRLFVCKTRTVMAVIVW